MTTMRNHSGIEKVILFARAVRNEIGPLYHFRRFSRTLVKAVVIRRLTADDLDRLFKPAERVLGEWWLAQQEHGELYVAVAEVNGALVGRGCLNFTSHSLGSGYCFVTYVRPELRSKGIGARIDQHHESVARARGLSALRCAVDKKTRNRSRFTHGAAISVLVNLSFAGSKSMVVKSKSIAGCSERSID
jgi:GNAT superfamily N-acetyltransferase